MTIKALSNVISFLKHWAGLLRFGLVNGAKDVWAFRTSLLKKAFVWGGACILAMAVMISALASIGAAYYVTNPQNLGVNRHQAVYFPLLSVSTKVMPSCEGALELARDNDLLLRCESSGEQALWILGLNETTASVWSRVSGTDHALSKGWSEVAIPSGQWDYALWQEMVGLRAASGKTLWWRSALPLTTDEFGFNEALTKDAVLQGVLSFLEWFYEAGFFGLLYILTLLCVGVLFDMGLRDLKARGVFNINKGVHVSLVALSPFLLMLQIHLLATFIVLKGWAGVDHVQQSSKVDILIVQAKQGCPAPAELSSPSVHSSLNCVKFKDADYWVRADYKPTLIQSDEHIRHAWQLQEEKFKSCLSADALCKRLALIPKADWQTVAPPEVTLKNYAGLLMGAPYSKELSYFALIAPIMNQGSSQYAGTYALVSELGLILPFLFTVLVLSLTVIVVGATFWKLRKESFVSLRRRKKPLGEVLKALGAHLWEATRGVVKLTCEVVVFLGLGNVFYAFLLMCFPYSTPVGLSNFRLHESEVFATAIEKSAAPLKEPKSAWSKPPGLEYAKGEFEYRQVSSGERVWFWGMSKKEKAAAGYGAQNAWESKGVHGESLSWQVVNELPVASARVYAEILGVLPRTPQNDRWALSMITQEQPVKTFALFGRGLMGGLFLLVLILLGVIVIGGISGLSRWMYKSVKAYFKRDDVLARAEERELGSVVKPQQERSTKVRL